jgi:hypothetical protein
MKISLRPLSLTFAMLLEGAGIDTAAVLSL